MSNVRLWDRDWDRAFVLDGRWVDPASRRILANGSAVEVEPRVMAVLVALAQRSGRTVRRRDLIKEVWDEAPGADQSLNNAVSLLRRALGDTDPERRLIQTLPKQGYRLCAPVEWSIGPQGAASPAATPGGRAPGVPAVGAQSRLRPGAGVSAEDAGDAQHAPPSTLPTHDFRAYEQYLIGNHEQRKFTPEGNRRSIEYFERAAALDPEFVEARVALGRAYYLAGAHFGWMTPKEAIPKVKASLVHGVIHGVSAASPATRAAALSVYGDLLAWSDNDWSGALAAYQRAHELSGTPTLGYALTNSIVGNHDAAIAILRGLLADGLGDSATRDNLAWAYFNARRYQDAIREARAVLAADDTFADAFRVLGRALLASGRTDEAIESLSDAVRFMNDAPAARSDLAVAMARAGREAEAQALLRALLDSDGYMPAPLIAQIHANLGDRDSAFEWLERGIEEGYRGAIFLKVDPLYDPLRGDPRFSLLLSRMNLQS